MNKSILDYLSSLPHQPTPVFRNQIIYRHAITGYMVTAEFASLYPSITTKEVRKVFVGFK